MTILRRAGIATALAAAPVAAAIRFALVYRARAGFPRRREPTITPADLGLPYEETVVESAGVRLGAWFLPARDGAPGPGVVVVHGWESARHRSLPSAQLLHAAGFHVLVFDVRGHGQNPAEARPLTAAEFGADARAAALALRGRPEVTTVGVLGYSMGGVGALIAEAGEPAIGAVVAISTPADPYRLTRLTFRLAGLPLPDPIAYPLAWLTAHLYVRPRGHRLADVSASAAAAAGHAPLLLVHGDADRIVWLDHLRRLEAAARSRARRGGVVETHVVAGGGHNWLYEDVSYRRAVADFLTRALGGPLTPDVAAERAGAVMAQRITEAEDPFGAVDEVPRLGRLLAELAGIRRGPAGEPDAAPSGDAAAGA